MKIHPMNHDRYELLRAEHEEICELITTLYRVLAEHHAPASRVVGLLQSLSERVCGHFQEEEECGLFEELGRVRPEKSNVFRQLEEEHDVLERQLRRLCEIADEGDLSPECWEQLEHRFREFGTALTQHESHENQELLDAYESDLGNQD